jgi:hypothetical protein
MNGGKDTHCVVERTRTAWWKGHALRASLFSVGQDVRSPNHSLVIRF